MFEIGMIHQDTDILAVSKLTDICFSSENFLKNFPQVFANTKTPKHILLKKEENLVGFCSVHPFFFPIKNTCLHAYCVGSVSIHPDFRNQGLGMQLLTAVDNMARENLVDFLFLFAPQENLYLKAGYKKTEPSLLAEFTSALALPQGEGEHVADLSTLPFSLKCKIWQFIATKMQPGEPIFSFLEFSQILSIPHMELFYLQQEEKIEALAFFNKGDDFQNVIHGLFYQNINSAYSLLSYVRDCKNVAPLYFFPGTAFPDFSQGFHFFSIPNVLVKSIAEKKITEKELISFFNSNVLSINSLQGC